MKILYLTYRPPLPVSGDRLRALQQIELLGARHHVRVLTAVRSSGEDAQVVALRARGLAIDGVRIDRGARMRLLRALAGRGPLQVAYYDDPGLRSEVRRFIAEQKPDAVWISILRMATHYTAHAPYAQVLDYCDALSAQYAARGRLQGGGPRGWLDRIEASRLRAYERWAAGAFDATCITSAVDRDAIGDPKPAVVPMHVQDYLDYSGPAQPLGDAAVVMTGELGSIYSQRSALWFVQDVWPTIAREVPGARLYLVGADPAPAIRALAGDRIAVTGFVDDPRAYVAAASVSIAPMVIGTGVKTKVIQAMALGRAVVATARANEGVGAADGEQLCASDGAEEFAAYVIMLLRDRDRARAIGDRARAFVAARFAAAPVARGLEAVLATALRRRDARAGVGRRMANV